MLGLSGADKQRLGTGKLINLIGGDATKVERMFWFLHQTWAGPLQVHKKNIYKIIFIYLEFIW